MEYAKNYVHVLIETLQKETQILEQVSALTREQSEIAAREDFEESMLDDSIRRKDVLITKLNELDDGFTAVYGRVREEMEANRAQYASELSMMQTLIQQCTDLGVEIRVAEERNRDKLTQRFSDRRKVYAAKRTAATVAQRYHRTMSGRGAVDNSSFNRRH